MGPGLANVVPGICHAAGVSSPVVLLAGTQPPIEEGMFASQQGSAVAMLKDVVKWARRVVEPATMSHWVRRALRECIQPNPGPVVLDFSLKLTNERNTQTQLKYVRDAARVAVLPQTAGDPDSVHRAVQALWRAQRPALERSFRSGKPALLNVIGEQKNVHPYRMRCNVVDTWTRGNFDRLPAQAQAEMRALPLAEFERASKRSRDNLFGTAVPVEELLSMVGRGSAG